MVAKIKDPKEFHELASFIPTANAVSAIPKTMSFVNSFDEKEMLANHLRNLLPINKKKDNKRLIQTFN